MPFKIPAILITISILISCSKSSTSSQGTTVIPVDSPFAKGADVSWITEMENSGISFYDRSGNKKELLGLLKSSGVNSIRLRTWVNPSNGYCNTTDLLAKAERASSLGMKIMIDFHYSDTWADPANQTKPLAWNNQDISALQTSVYNYTSSVLTTLKNAQVTPTWVQVGNETNDGMLWPEGKASVNMNNFALLINSGYKATKDVFPSAKVVVHLSNAYDNSLFRWIFDGLAAHNANWDVIGMSLYPTAGNWDVLNTQCYNNMKDMIARYNKPVIISEVGMPQADSSACYSFLSDLSSKLRSLPNGQGLGFFYWEPETYNNWKGYKLGAFNENGTPSLPFSAFK